MKGAVRTSAGSKLTEPTGTHRETLYFPNLNSVRFFAAFLVIVTHVEQYAALSGLSNHYDRPWASTVGPTGVILFFVLSGFLITYLLMQEKATTGTVARRDFYLRRVCRIWPLYYAIGVLAFVLSPSLHFLRIPGLWDHALDSHWGTQCALYLFMLPNVALVLFPPVLYAAQAWSVGVEEQFYLVWPLLIRRSENTRRMLMAVLLGYLAIKALLFLLRHTFSANHAVYVLLDLWIHSSIDCMAIGGLMAWMLFHRRTRELSWVFNPYLQTFTYLVTIVFLVTGFGLRYHLDVEVYAVLFAIIIGNLAGNPRSLVNIEIAPLRYLGKISYGLYMYHPLAIVIAIKTLRSLTLLSWPSVYVVTVLLTILISHVSYRWFERPFLRAKLRFSPIVSGDNAPAETLSF